MNFTENLNFSCTGSPLACSEVGFPVSDAEQEPETTPPRRR